MNGTPILASALLVVSAGVHGVAASPAPVCPGSTEKAATAAQSGRLAAFTINLKLPEGAAADEPLSKEAVSLIVSNFKAALDSLQSKAQQEGRPNSDRKPADELRITFAFEAVPAVQVEATQSGLKLLDQLENSIECIEFPTQERAQLPESVPLIRADVRGAIRGNGRMVAILDTGIDNDHPFLKARIVVERQACFRIDSGCPSGAVSQTGAGSAQSSVFHGTHVAGIAAGAGGQAYGKSFAGVAPGAQLIPVNIFTGKYTDSRDQEKALDYVIKLRRDDKLPIAAVNMSIGGDMGYSSACDTSFVNRARLFKQLRALNVAPVVAAGNNGFSNAVSAPACLSSAVAVSSIDKAGKLWTGENRSSLTAVLAPGIHILSSSPGGQYAYASGTSMAAPHVTGAFAVVSAAVSDASTDAILKAFQDSGTAVRDPTNDASYRRIDVEAAIQKLEHARAVAAISTAARRPEAATQESRFVRGSPIFSAEGYEIARLAETPTSGYCKLDLGFVETEIRYANVPCSSLISFEGRAMISGLSQETLHELARFESNRP
ncbi:MAG: in [Methylobacteriaceae bacterium]|nr:in [Methylobacteriaceae bacterium]